MFLVSLSRLWFSGRMVHGVFGLVLVILALFQGSSVYAASNNFIVRTFVGSDTTPPTVPTGLTATPIATSQINLAWSASTDDFELSGYQVFRDGVQIATTTTTAYSDVGLSASTTYSYYLTAFDTFNNISASSTVVATTTFATPTTPVETEIGGTTFGTRIRLPGLISLEVIPSQYGAIVRYETAIHVRTIVRWGRSISYEIGSSAERSYSRFHEVRIDDLSPDTQYRFSIYGEDHMGISGVLTESSFVTLPLDDTTPPGVVTGFSVHPEGNDAKLTWQNPSDIDFSHVRILRSESFFPGNIDEGWLVYEGDGTEAFDSDVVEEGRRLYYTIFAYDESGNISSGAVAWFSISGEGSVPEVVVDPSRNDIELTFDSILFYQDNKEVPHDRGTVSIDGGKHLTIAIPYASLPEHLKTILVSVVPEHDASKVLSFILHINSLKTAYTARLAPLGIGGDFTVRVSVFDFKTAQVGYTSGKITSAIQNYAAHEPAGDRGVLWETILMVFVRNYVWIFISFLLLLLLLARKLLAHT